MIGRAALGNPWMIYQTVKYLETGELTGEPSVREKMDVCTLHLDRLIALKGENVGSQGNAKTCSLVFKRNSGKCPVFEMPSMSAIQERNLLLYYMD